MNNIENGIYSYNEDITNLIRTPEQTGADFYVCDPDGNVLAEFRNGHIHLKNFDSDDALTADDLTEIETTISSLTEAVEAAPTTQDLQDVADDVAEVSYGLSKASETKETTALNVDLDIVDTSGNVAVRFADGHIQTKHFNSKGREILYSGIPSNGEVLFNLDDVAVGEKVVLIFSVSQSLTGAFIEIKNKQGSRITYIGRQASGAYTDYAEIYEIPDNFKEAIATFTDSEMTVYAIASMDSIIGPNLYKLWSDKHDVTDYTFSTKNRLANPLFTSLEKYNIDHQNAQIEAESALYRGVTGNATYRIPAVAVTNSGTTLVAGTHMTHAMGDYGDFSIDLARKPVGGDWSITEVVPFDTTREDYGSVLNNEFLVDRNSGRIYLFYGTEKECLVWWDVDVEGGDFRYIYSDDDGENWSNPVSLKSLWDTDVYDYCIPSCTKGIMLTNGTYVIPCFCKKGTLQSAKSYPLLLIKKPNGEWYFSSVASVTGIDHLDECAVVEGINTNEIWLYCRPNSNYGTGVNRGYNKFVYNILTDTFTHLNCTFDGNRHNCFGIDRITIDGQLIYLMTFTDANGTKRENITLWASLDGDTWIRVYRMNKNASNGYSLVDNYNGKIVVVYEYTGTNGGEIKYQDISPLSTLIYDSATKYIERNISVQDRMQMLFNKLNGID